MNELLKFLVLCILVVCQSQHAEAQFVGGQVRQLLATYGIEVTELTCVGGILSRSGHCFFQIATDEASLKAKLNQALDGRRPKNQLQMDPLNLGSGTCKEAFQGINPIVPKTQLGGDSLPYLGSVFFDGRVNRGCLEFQYGYG